VNDPESVDAATLARLADRRARQALHDAPEIVEHLRALSTPTDGRVERGVEIPMQATPLLAGTVDDADEFYAILIEWVDYWRETLHGTDPVEHVAAWRNYQDSHRGKGFADAPVLGLPAHTRAGVAGKLTRVLASWLLARADMIAAHQAAAEFHEDVATRVFKLRAKYRMLLPKPPKQASRRPCPVCGEYEVSADYFGGSLAAAELRGDLKFDHLAKAERERQAVITLPGIEVKCGHCGWVADIGPAQLARWIS